MILWAYITRLLATNMILSKPSSELRDINSLLGNCSIGNVQTLNHNRKKGNEFCSKIREPLGKICTYLATTFETNTHYALTSSE